MSHTRSHTVHSARVSLSNSMKTGKCYDKSWRL